MQAIVGGKAAPPPEGARFDKSLEGSVEGPKLKGSWHGVEYVNIRADGRAELHIHGHLDLIDEGRGPSQMGSGLSTRKGSSNFGRA